MKEDEIITHDLKTWPEPFEAVFYGRKTHEVRANDRAFAVGDRLWLREWQPPSPESTRGHYTGRSVTAEITHITLGGTFGLPAEICVMSIRKIR